MAFASLIENSLSCKLNAYYRVDNSLFEECLEGMPAYANCLLCGIDKLSGAYEITYFIPHGTLFEKNHLAALFDKPYYFDLVFFDTELNKIPVFSCASGSAYRVNSLSQMSSFIELVGYEDRNSFLFKNFIQAATLEKISMYILRDMHVNHEEVFRKITDLFGNERLLKILTHIHMNITEDLTLEQLATLVFLSPDYISQFFKRCMGTGIQNYLIDQRVKLGLHHLVSSSDQISAIAEHTGFVDQAYFNRRFKAVYGFNPLKFRKKYQLLSISKTGAELMFGR